MLTYNAPYLPHQPIVTSTGVMRQLAPPLISQQHMMAAMFLQRPVMDGPGLIAMAILNSPDKKLVLSDIYQFILDNYPYFRSRGAGWRNSIRHNLSLNDCFVKTDRSSNGKGHYWAIHPACSEDFTRGDFRRRHAQRKVRKAMGLSVPDGEEDSDEAQRNSPSPNKLSSQPHTLQPPNCLTESLNHHQRLMAFQQVAALQAAVTQMAALAGRTPPTVANPAHHSGGVSPIYSLSSSPCTPKLLLSRSSCAKSPILLKRQAPDDGFFEENHPIDRSHLTTSPLKSPTDKKEVCQSPWKRVCSGSERKKRRFDIASLLQPDSLTDSEEHHEIKD